jgi:hypothetical protein
MLPALNTIFKIPKNYLQRSFYIAEHLSVPRE